MESIYLGKEVPRGDRDRVSSEDKTAKDAFEGRSTGGSSRQGVRILARGRKCSPPLDFSDKVKLRLRKTDLERTSSRKSLV